MSVSSKTINVLEVGLASRAAAAELAGILNNASSVSLADLAATAAELNKTSDVSGRVVATGVSATVYAITATVNGGRVLNVNTTVPIAITLPAASGSFEEYKIRLTVVATATPHVIKVANSVDNMAGSFSVIAHTATGEVNGFLATATDDTITLNGTTLGGLVGDIIEVIDIASGKFQVRITGKATGTVATPFSATVP